MAVVLKLTCLALVAMGSVQSAELPVGKCSLSDKACLIPAAQKMVPVFTAGMPQFGVEVLDPAKNFGIEYDLSGLQFSLTDGTLSGLKSVVINDIDFDTTKKVLVIAFTGDLSVEGHYTAGGKVLVHPISGDGRMKLDMKNMYIKILIDFETVNGHVKPTKYTSEFELKDSAHFDLTNLFNGDKELSEHMIKFLNENYKQIFGAFGKPLVDTAAEHIYKNIAIFFEKLPIADIANI